jgi:hypothetical protein
MSKCAKHDTGIVFPVCSGCWADQRARLEETTKEIEWRKSEMLQLIEKYEQSTAALGADLIAEQKLRANAERSSDHYQDLLTAERARVAELEAQIADLSRPVPGRTRE